MHSTTMDGYVPVLYGAYELKQGYRSAMIAALVIAVLGHLLVVGSILCYQALTKTQSGPIGESPTRPEGTRGKVIVRHIPPLPRLETSGRMWTQAAVEPPVFGKIEPVPDDEVIEEPVFPTRNTPVDIAGPIVIGTGAGTAGLDGSGGPGATGEFGFQAPAMPSGLVGDDAELPVLVRQEEPVFPDLALLTDVNGSVVIRALVDDHGIVREACVHQSSGTHAGFDEAARVAAFGNRYKPAIQHGRSVATWVIYRVEFKIKR